ncbi:hypothetical protein HGRIS_008936 [Hohenbuehelia grisea]|uniref:Uncharacterized protein n=1 Tax=Hohenbuehelia grisea TaxID=104357 RepID=A0ABR3IZK2_9AGAR
MGPTSGACANEFWNILPSTTLKHTATITLPIVPYATLTVTNPPRNGAISIRQSVGAGSLIVLLSVLLLG